jgi:hypothetical protein
VCRVAIHLNARVEDIVLGETDPILEALEQLANFAMSLCMPDTFPLPNAIFHKNADNPILVVIIIANIAVFGFELFDCFNIVKYSDLSGQFRIIHVCTPPLLHWSLNRQLA